ncbi:hypothetical protein ATANTOWER_020952, partial [Ataeniobius toweri]|nr:hypothetical protein [Ataeniobius toweri]
MLQQTLKPSVNRLTGKVKHVSVRPRLRSQHLPDMTRFGEDFITTRLGFTSSCKGTPHHPRLETESGNHGESQQWAWQKETACAPPPPLCEHTPYMKPSDACDAALTCQSDQGEDPTALPPLSIQVTMYYNRLVKNCLISKGTHGSGSFNT